MNNDNEQLVRLNAVSDVEWRNVVNELTKYVYFKLKGKTGFGAHTEQNLGAKPVEYYVNGAVAKLFSLEWEWQFKKFTLLEQLQRIVGSMMSSNVEKERNKKDKLTYHDEEELVWLAGTEENEEDNLPYKLFREALHACSQDDEELQLYVMALDECKSFAEISVLLGLEKPKLYVLQKKITRRIKTYLEKKNKPGT